MFFCADCGEEFAKWEGKCRSCGAWNTLREAPAGTVAKKGGKSGGGKTTGAPARPVLRAADVTGADDEKIATGVGELDHLFGGGVPKGAVFLLAGEPGVGKSTLLLLLASRWTDRPILYVCGEETPSQLRQRMDRLGVPPGRMDLTVETSLDRLESAVGTGKYSILMVDSIQTVGDDAGGAPAGSPAQLRAAAHRLVRLAKTTGTAVLATGHITKAGDVAGPKLLEHMVDGTFLMETEPGTGLGDLRVFRPLKNRFGPTDAAGVFTMGPEGLRPSERAVYGGAFEGAPVPGAVHHPHFLAKRIFFSSIEALCVAGAPPAPRRSAEGIAFNRMTRLVAVLEKYSGASMAPWDLYLHVGGGIRDEDPAMDLALLAALQAAVGGLRLPRTLLFLGEVGLSGQVRPPRDLDARLRTIRAQGPFTVAGPGPTDHPVHEVAELLALVARAGGPRGI